MNKPLTMVVKETKTKLAEVCNEAGLPLVVLDLVIQGLYSEIHSLAERQTVEEEKMYTEFIANNGIKNNDDMLGDADETK